MYIFKYLSLEKNNLKLLMVMTMMMTTVIMKFLCIFVAVQILLKFVSFSARAAGVLLKFLPLVFDFYWFHPDV